MTRLLRLTNGNYVKFHKAGCRPVSYEKDPTGWTEIIEDSDIYYALSFSPEEFLDFIVTKSKRVAEKRGETQRILRSELELIPD